MKKAITFIFILFFISLILPAQSIEKETVEAYENGKPKLIHVYMNGKTDAHIIRKEYYGENGKKTKEENYTAGKLDGMVEVWNEKGFKTSEENYLEGILHGKVQVWNEATKQMVKEFSYSNGKLSGDQKLFFGMGEPKAVLHYSNGTLDGTQKAWFTPDQQHYELNFSNGVYHGQQREWYRDGSEKYNLNFVAGKPDGVQKWYKEFSHEMTLETWKMGRFESEIEFWNGKNPRITQFYTFEISNPDTVPLVGKKVMTKEVRFYETGSIQAITKTEDANVTTKVMYANGNVKGEGGGTFEKPDGPWVYFHKNGKKWKEGSYAEGKQDGKWMEWNEDGKKQSESQWDGKGSYTKEAFRLKSWKVYFYYKSGEKESEGNLDALGRKDGAWTYYYPNGVKKREEKYSKDCESGDARPFCEDLKEWYEDGSLKIEGNERKYKEYKYFSSGKKQFEDEYFLPFRSNCDKEKFEYYEDAKMQRQKFAQHPKTGMPVNIDSTITLLHIEYKRTGGKLVVDKYDNKGVREGLQEGWYANEKKKYEYNFREGQADGKIQEWYETGEPMLDLNFASGNLVYGKYYTDNGKEMEYESSKGKDKKKKMLEIEAVSYFFTEFK